MKKYVDILDLAFPHIDFGTWKNSELSPYINDLGLGKIPSSPLILAVRLENIPSSPPI